MDLISAAVVSFVAKALIPSPLVGKFAMVAVHVSASSESKIQKLSSFSSNEITFCLNKSGL